MFPGVPQACMPAGAQDPASSNHDVRYIYSQAAPINTNSEDPGGYDGQLQPQSKYIQAWRVLAAQQPTKSASMQQRERNMITEYDV